MTTTEIKKGLVDGFILKSDLSKALGISIASINQYVHQGMPVAIRGKGAIPHQFDLEECRDWIEKNVKATGGSIKDAKMNAAKLRKMEAEAALAELELQRERGELVEIAEVARMVEKEYTTVRAKLLSLPSKVSGIIYSQQSQMEVSETLDKAVREILQELTADNGNTE